MQGSGDDLDMRSVVLLAAFVGAVSGCATSNVPILTAAFWGGAQPEPTAPAAAVPAVPDDTALPSPRPTLSYDIDAVSKLEPWKDKTTPICDRVARWTAYVAELPPSERQRYARLSSSDRGAGDWRIAGARRNDPYFRLQATAKGLVDKAWSQGAQLIGMAYDTTDEELAEKLSRVSLEDMQRAEVLYGCAGIKPPARLATEIESRKAVQTEADRCAADPACVAQQKRERLTALREVMCQDVGQRQDAQASIREEWKYAHQAGVVDLQNLSDNRTLLEMADERLREGQAEWKYLTGKPFTPKRDCVTAAAR
jgi:hypothetical protein